MIQWFVLKSESVNSKTDRQDWYNINHHKRSKTSSNFCRGLKDSFTLTYTWGTMKPHPHLGQIPWKDWVNSKELIPLLCDDPPVEWRRFAYQFVRGGVSLFMGREKDSCLIVTSQILADWEATDAARQGSSPFVISGLTPTKNSRLSTLSTHT